MSTIGYKDWNVDLAEVGAIYPFQGWEGTMGKDRTAVCVIVLAVRFSLSFASGGNACQ